MDKLRKAETVIVAILVALVIANIAATVTLRKLNDKSKASIARFNFIVEQYQIQLETMDKEMERNDLWANE